MKLRGSVGPLERLSQYLAQAGFTYEMLAVLDGPTGETHNILQQTARRNSHLKIIHRAENRGKRYTVREGMLKASGRIRLFTDADNSTDIAQFNKMKPLFDQGFDVVIASRNPKNAPQADYKRAIGQIGTESCSP